MTDETTARDRAISMAQRLEWAAAEEPGYKFLLRTVREAALVLREAAAAPTADVAIVQAARAWKAKRDQLQYPPPPTRVDDLDVQNTSLPEARALYEAVAAAPEGVDAADVMAGWPSLDEEEAEAARAEQRQRDGMDLEAQGEMAAAQAAIQRVRELAEEYQRGPASGPSAVHEHIATRIRRALDGDTAEEKR